MGFLFRDPQNDYNGRLFIGGVDENFFEGEITYSKVSSFLDWEIDLQKFVTLGAHFKLNNTSSGNINRYLAHKNSGKLILFSCRIPSLS